MVGLTPAALRAMFEAAQAGELRGVGGTRRRLLPEHALDIFVEVRFPDGEWALLVSSTENLGDRELVLAAGLTCRCREGRLEVVAQPTTDRHMFCVLLADLLNHLRWAQHRAATALVARLTAWQAMLGRGPRDGLSRAESIGLLGELLVLRDVVLPFTGAGAAKSWVGPTGAAQDFRAEDWALEVKSVSANTLRCMINGAGQLDRFGLRELVLVYQVLARDDLGVTLGALVEEVRTHPALGADRPLVDNLLLQAGWMDAHRERYERDRYRLSRRYCYRVRNDFPVLAPTDLPHGVLNVSYSIDLSTCAHALVDEPALGDILAPPPNRERSRA
ncbi:PD-(D/E)XK motif protein [Embleya scabrispora]|uniref:PD-(D/E)XK motif protein n=1 Tax=Embleya scabrispora TaxID=159449 RepID=UPI0003AA14BB|nr:PD-(D/E)XK motif protein [Embleya scabrispora]MYS81058.1 PD-(D/E)XK motif protein [Streptomyces sp. SID5474]